MTTLANVNYWPDARCAKAFWGQQSLPAYRRLLGNTVDWAAPEPGESWLDLGCGGGALTRAIWQHTQGGVGRILGVDCAEVNAKPYALMADEFGAESRVVFARHDFSEGLPALADGEFDHAVSGLSISYAESFDAAAGRWTQDAYDRVLAEAFRVIRPGGRFVFSVNVPRPSWLKVGLSSCAGVAQAPKPLRLMSKVWRMYRYGRWLSREARRGRFHYLPAADVKAKLLRAGFASVESRVSYAGQAFIFRARKAS